MFLETAVAMFCLGFLAAYVLCWTVAIRPMNLERRARDRADRREMRRRLYRMEVRREHLGTPYIRRPYVAPLPSELERLLADVADPTLDGRLADNERWSVKAPTLRSVS